MKSHTPKRSFIALRRLTAAFLVTAVAAAVLAPASALLAAPSLKQPPVQTVVVVLSPFLTWSDVTSGGAGALLQAAGDGAVANMNAMTADPGWPTVAGGALTLSASRWTAGPIGVAADPRQLAAIKAANAGSLDQPDIGALGATIHAAGGRTAAVGNSDEDTSTPAGTRRPAALLAMDRQGRVDIQLTSPALLTADPGAPFGVRADPKAMGTAVRIALADNPALLVIDPGDLERAHDDHSRTAEQAALAHATAVASLGDLLTDVRSALGARRALLMIVTPATDKPYYQPPYFAPIIVDGLNLYGDLTSSSTHRPGLLANLDVGPTALAALGIEANATMVGQPMTASKVSAAPSGPDGSATIAPVIEGLDTLGASVGFVDYVRDLYFIGFFAWAAALIALFAAAIALVPALQRARQAGRWLVLFALAIPSGAWLMFAVNRYPASPGSAALALAIATLAIFALSVGLSRLLRLRAEITMLALSTLTSLVIMGDQWTGRPLESGLFSYSIRAGWRYYGMGNEGAALLVGASIIAVGLACDLWAGTRWGRALRAALMPLVAIVAILTTAAPFAGANAGVALWGVVAYGVAWVRVNRAHFTWKSALEISGAIVVIVAAFVAIDMLRGSGETHLGRFATEALHGDFSAVGGLIYRKAANNLGYISQTPYTWLAVAMAAALAVLRWTGSKPLVAALRERPGVAGALAGVVAGGIAAALTEDSGVVMPALMLFAGAMPVLYLCLADSSETPLDPDVT